MNMFKKIFIPSGDQKELTALENWTVRWNSRYANSSYATRQEVEIFTNEEEAKEFARALRNAFKLLKFSGGEVTSILLEKTK